MRNDDVTLVIVGETQQIAEPEPPSALHAATPEAHPARAVRRKPSEPSTPEDATGDANGLTKQETACHTGDGTRARGGRMNWPLASDYQDAVQNPAQCFQDPQLRGGQPVLTKIGLPRVASGMFASVYEIHNGTQRWAVRCFLRPSADQQESLRPAQSVPQQHDDGGIVGFAYEAQGIQIQGQWYPIVKMDWVEGNTLHTYIGKLFEDGQQAGIPTPCANWPRNGGH